MKIYTKEEGDRTRRILRCRAILDKACTRAAYVNIDHDGPSLALILTGMDYKTYEVHLRYEDLDFLLESRAYYIKEHGNDEGTVR